MGESVPRAGHAVLAQHRLHLCLVAEVVRLVAVHPRDAQPFAHLCEGHLQLFECAQQPVDATQVPHERLDALRDLRGVGAVVDPVVAGEPAAHLRGQAVLRVLRNQPETRVKQPRRRRDETDRGVHEEGRHEHGVGHRAAV